MNEDSETEVEMPHPANESPKTKLTILDGKFFKPVLEKSSSSSNSMIAECIICQPKYVEVKGTFTSSSNFVSHVKRKHDPPILKEYEDYKNSTKRIRLAENSTGHETNKKCVGKSTQASQTLFDENLSDFIIDSMIPFRAIENPFLKKMIDNLNVRDHGKPLKVISRRTLCRRIKSMYEENRKTLQKKLQEEAEYVCTTADVWSTRKRSFLGGTVHWIDPKTLSRKSAALACRRFTGTHSFDRIATSLEDIHSSYGLSLHKIVATVTDNGSNFVKAFKEFGLQLERDHNDIEENEENNEGESSGSKYGEMNANENIDGWEFEPLAIPLPPQNVTSMNENMEERTLPLHVRCGPHTLNLTASADVTKTIKATKALKCVHERVMEKCNTLWKFANPPKSAEKIEEVLGHTLSRPGETRWNSLHDSLKQITTVRSKSVELNSALNIKNGLKDNDFQYIEEHVKCTAPVATALDKLQGDKNMYYGFFLPTLLILRRELQNLQGESLRYCKPLLQSLLASVLSRFEEFFELSTPQADIAVIAALSHPKFKNRWFSCMVPRQDDRLQNLFISAVNEVYNSQHSAQIEDHNDESDYYNFGSNDSNSVPSSNQAKIEVLKFFGEQRQDLSLLEAYPAIKKVFIKYNTCLTSSAPVERLFSFATMTNVPKSNRISDEMFEARVLLKYNSLSGAN